MQDAYCAVCCRQQKSKQLKDLQSELQLLESDIKQVAARQPDTNAALHEQRHQLPSRQPSTQLLQERLQEAMTTVADAAKQPSARSDVKSQATQGTHSQAVQAAPVAHVRQPASLAPALRLPATPQTTVGPSQQQLTPSIILPSPAAAASAQQLSGQPGIVLAQPGGSQLPIFPPSAAQGAASQLPASSTALNPSRSLEPRLSRASNGYLMIAHPYPTPPAPPQPTAAAPGSSAPAAAATPATAAGLAGGGAAVVASNTVPPVPLPTQMDRQHSMHIHPRHLAFQHFHQQQAALQQRQQPAGQSWAGAGRAHAASSGGAAPDESSAQAVTQEAAVRCDCSCLWLIWRVCYA